MGSAEYKRRRGDRKDGRWLRDIDAMHVFMPYLMPNRADNEAVMNETIDLTAVNDYLVRKNALGDDFKYTLFHVICAAIAKTIVLRPKMNRFIAGHRIYERYAVSLSFVVKKQFNDASEEALAVIEVDKSGESPIEQIHSKVKKIVRHVRTEGNVDGATSAMSTLARLPRWVMRILMRFLRWLDYHGWVPASLSKDDPDYCSVFLSNLGSIKMHASYHHLVNWGTNSFFVIVGEKHMTPYYNADGTYDMREALELGLTIDERIADGLYFANSARILRRLIAEPDLLDLPIEAPLPDIGDRQAK